MQNHVIFITLKKLIHVLFDRIYIYFIARDLNINKWHLSAVFPARIYKAKILEISHQYKFNTCIEIGCGTGDIISKIKCKNLIGVDIDVDVLKLCNRLHPNIDLNCFNVFEDFYKLDSLILSDTSDHPILIIMVNWLHIYPQHLISHLINSLLKLDRKIMILSDIYIRNHYSKIPSNIKYNHDLSSFNKQYWYRRFYNLDKVRDANMIANYLP